MDYKEGKILGIEDVQKILSKTLLDLSKRKISLKQAQVTSRIALALSKNLEHVELKKQLDFIQQTLEKR